MKIGKVSENVLKRSVFRQIKTKRKEVISGAVSGGDCAFFASAENGELMASCMREAAVAVGTNRNATAVPVGILLQKCVNNLACGGAEPLAVQITLLLPEDAEESVLKQLMSEAEETSSKLSMQIAGGQTRLTKAVNTPYAVVTGYGRVKSGEVHTIKEAKPGEDIVISKWIGLEGTAMLAKSYREKLLERYPAYLVEEAAGFSQYISVLSEATIARKYGVGAMHDASEGGIFATLWELAEAAGVGLTIDMKKLPIRQETVEVCEYLGANPYELMSGGSLIMLTVLCTTMVVYPAMHELGHFLAAGLMGCKVVGFEACENVFECVCRRSIITFPDVCSIYSIICRFELCISCL